MTGRRAAGAVFAAFMFIQSVAMLLGAGIAGTLTDRFGVIAVLTGQGVGYAVAGVIFAVAVRRGHPQRRHRRGGDVIPTSPARAGSGGQSYE